MGSSANQNIQPQFSESNLFTGRNIIIKLSVQVMAKPFGEFVRSVHFDKKLRNTTDKKMGLL